MNTYPVELSSDSAEISNEENMMCCYPDPYQTDNISIHLEDYESLKYPNFLNDKGTLIQTSYVHYCYI